VGGSLVPRGTEDSVVVSSSFPSLLLFNSFTSPPRTSLDACTTGSYFQAKGYSVVCLSKLGNHSFPWKRSSALGHLFFVGFGKAKIKFLGLSLIGTCRPSLFR